MAVIDDPSKRKAAAGAAGVAAGAAAAYGASKAAGLTPAGPARVTPAAPVPAQAQLAAPPPRIVATMAPGTARVPPAAAPAAAPAGRPGVLYAGPGQSAAPSPASRALAGRPANAVVPAGPRTMTQGATLTPQQIAAQRGNLGAQIPQTPRQAATNRAAEQLDSSGRRAAGGQPRAATPPGPGATATPRAAAPAAAPGPTGAATRVPGAGGRKLKSGAAGVALMEGARVAEAGRDGGGRAAIAETGAAAGRLGAARAAMAIAPKAPWAQLGAGAIGYMGGNTLVDGISNAMPQGVKDGYGKVMDFAQQAGNQLWSGENENIIRDKIGVDRRPNAGGFGDLMFGGREEKWTAVPQMPGAAAAPAAATPPAAEQLAAPLPGVGAPMAQPPAAAPAAGANDVLGTFNGRQITRAQSDELAGKLPTASGPVVMGPNGSYAAATGGSAPAAAAAPNAAAQLAAPRQQAQGAVIGNPQSDLLGQISEQIKGVGELDRRSKRDMVTNLLGLKERLTTGREGNQSAEGIAAANNAQEDAATQLAAQIDREQTAAGERNAALGARSKPEQITGADGNLYSLDGGKLAPVTSADGQPFKPAPTKASPDNALQVKLAELLGSQLTGGETPEQIKSAYDALSALPLFQQGNGGTTKDAIAGYTPDGKPVYVGADGKKYTEE